MNEQELKNKSLTIVEKSHKLIVVSPQDNEVATNLLRTIMQAKKMITDYWKEPIDKAHKAHKALTAKKTEMLKPITMAESIIKSKVGEYLTKLEKERVEKERKLNEKAKEKGINISLTVDKQEKPQGQITKERWSAKVVEFSKLPDKYKLPDMQTLNAIARTEKENAKVEGVEFVKELSVEVR